MCAYIYIYSSNMLKYKKEKKSFFKKKKKKRAPQRILSPSHSCFVFVFVFVLYTKKNYVKPDIPPEIERVYYCCYRIAFFPPPPFLSLLKKNSPKFFPPFARESLALGLGSGNKHI